MVKHVCVSFMELNAHFQAANQLMCHELYVAMSVMLFLCWVKETRVGKSFIVHVSFDLRISGCGWDRVKLLVLLLS